MQAYYINLLRAVERRNNFEKRLHGLSIPFEVKRFEALDGQGYSGELAKGEIGIFLSHAMVVRECNVESPLFIFEDDAIITKSFLKILPGLLAADGVDIIFLNGGATPMDTAHTVRLLNLKRTLPDIYSENFSDFKMYPASYIYQHGASSYMLTPGGVGKLQALYANALAGGRIIHPLDIFLKQKIAEGALAGAVVFPFLCGIDYDALTQVADRPSSIHAPTNDAAANLFVADRGLFDALELYANRSSRKHVQDVDCLVMAQLFATAMRAMVT
jgi:GR25 family glycosyltransferase involved in LPS biosynthesis